MSGNKRITNRPIFITEDTRHRMISESVRGGIKVFCSCGEWMGEYSGLELYGDNPKSFFKDFKKHKENLVCAN